MFHYMLLLVILKLPYFFLRVNLIFSFTLVPCAFIFNLINKSQKTRLWLKIFMYVYIVTETPQNQDNRSPFVYRRPWDRTGAQDGIV